MEQCQENFPFATPSDLEIFGNLTLAECAKCVAIWNSMSDQRKAEFSNMTTDWPSWSSLEPKESYIERDPMADMDCSCRPMANRRCNRRKKWVRPGPVTTNPYLNYVRVVRRRYWGIMPRQLIILAAYEWRHLSDAQRAKYQRQADAVKAQLRKKKRILRKGR